MILASCGFRIGEAYSSTHCVEGAEEEDHPDHLHDVALASEK